MNKIKVFEGDKLLLAGETDKALSQQVHTDNSQAGLSAKQLAEIEEIVSITEKLMADDRESIIVNERYDLIGHIVQLCVTQTETGKINLTDRIDQIITHKWLGLPIFVFVMWLVYFISIQTVGTAATDWLNDVFFGQWLPDLIANGMNALAVTPWVQDLVLNGVVAGIGAILGFCSTDFCAIFTFRNSGRFWIYGSGSLCHGPNF